MARPTLRFRVSRDLGLAALVLPMQVGCSAEGSAPAGNQQDGRQRDAPARPIDAAGSCVGPITDTMLNRCDFGPREELSGVWVSGFERSEFVPGGTGARAPGDPGPRREWLAFAPGVYPDPAVRAELDALRATGAVEIVFEGRRARSPGAVVVVDRVISMRVLGPTR